MLLTLTPLNFVLFSSYVLLLFLLFFESDPLNFWFIMELTTIFFIGMCFSSFVCGFSNLIVYFLVQSVSSLVLLVGISMLSTVACTLSFLIKFGIFPFIFWYVSSVYSFGSLIFFVILTFQNVPLLVFFAIFGSNLLIVPLVLFSSIVGGIVGGISILACSDLRMLLVFSSFSSSSWLLFSCVNFWLTFLFLSFYSLSLFFILSEISGLSNTFTSSLYALLLLVSVSGLPPFPVFMLKILIVYFAFGFCVDSFLLFTLLLVSVLTVVGYFSFGFKYLIYGRSVGI